MKLVIFLLMAAAAAWGQPAPAEPGLKKGAVIPAFSLPDQDGHKQTLQSLKGPKGLMLVFVRSADWCIYCKVQLVEFEQNLQVLRKQGLGLAVIGAGLAAMPMLPANALPSDPDPAASSPVKETPARDKLGQAASATDLNSVHSTYPSSGEPLLRRSVPEGSFANHGPLPVRTQVLTHGCAGRQWRRTQDG